MSGRKKVKGTSFHNSNYELIKQTQRFLFAYQQMLSDEIFKKGKLSFAVKEKSTDISYEMPAGKALIEVCIPFNYDGRRSIEEMKFLIQDFVLNAFYSYEREPMDDPKLKLLKLGAIL